MTKTHNIARYEYAGFDGCRSWCRLEIWQETGHVVVHDVVRQATPAQLGTAIRGLLPAPTK